MRIWSRRDFTRMSAIGVAAAAAGSLGWRPQNRATVSLVSVGSVGRDAAIRRAVELVGFPDVAGKSVALKPNVNSAHEFPGSTHNDTLSTMVRLLNEHGANRVVVPDRSGMGDVRQVMEDKGVLALADELGFEAMPLQDLEAEDWVRVANADMHWSQGYFLARVFRQVDTIVQTCCLKTHAYGGHFTMSLKNSVGMVARDVPGIEHGFMRELHRSPDQRRMIAEINLGYNPSLVVLDAIDCFTDGGPAEGAGAHPNVVLASTDRVAIDAVGVAILREKGTNENVSAGAVFEQEQIARAVELGIGVGRPEGIEIMAADAESERYANVLKEILLA